MSKLEDTNNLLGKGDFTNDDSIDAKQMHKSRQESEVAEDELCKVPEKLSIAEWIIVGVLYLIFAFLVGFIIYISSTWNKDRTNEYT